MLRFIDHRCHTYLNTIRHQQFVEVFPRAPPPAGVSKFFRLSFFSLRYSHSETDVRPEQMPKQDDREVMETDSDSIGRLSSWVLGLTVLVPSTTEAHMDWRDTPLCIFLYLLGGTVCTLYDKIPVFRRIRYEIPNENGDTYLNM